MKMIKQIFYLTTLLFISSTLILDANASDIESQTEVWNSQNSLKKLQDSKYNNDFYQLVNFYQPQENPLYCGPASAAILLNAFNYRKIDSQKTGEIYKPQGLGGDLIPYKLYSQKDFFNKKTEKIKKQKVVELREPKEIKNGDHIYDAGVSLKDFAEMLENGHDLNVKIIYTSKNNESSINKFRANLKTVLSENKKFILANFDGKILGNKTSGHISPIVSYNETDDSILILDVALHKNQWFWVNVSKFYEAMNSKDDKNYRGYLIISK